MSLQSYSQTVAYHCKSVRMQSYLKMQTNICRWWYSSRWNPITFIICFKRKGKRSSQKFCISIMKHLNVIVFYSKPLLLAEVYQLQIKWLSIEPGRTWEILPGKVRPVFSLPLPSSIKKMKTKNLWSDLSSGKIYLQSTENLKGESYNADNWSTYKILKRLSVCLRGELFV